MAASTTIASCTGRGKRGGVPSTPAILLSLLLLPLLLLDVILRPRPTPPRATPPPAAAAAAADDDDDGGPTETMLPPLRWASAASMAEEAELEA